jgi:hypothetical protein
MKEQILEQFTKAVEQIRAGAWDLKFSSFESSSDGREIRLTFTARQAGLPKEVLEGPVDCPPGATPEALLPSVPAAEDTGEPMGEQQITQTVESAHAVSKPRKIYPTEAERLEYLPADTPVRAKFRNLISILPNDMKYIANASGKGITGIAAIFGLHAPCKHATAQLIANAATTCGYGITADQICDGYDSRSRYMGRTPKSKWQKTYAAENKDVRRNHEQKYAARVEEGTLTTDEAHKLDILTKYVRPFDRPTRLYPERSEVPATKRLAVALPWEKQKKMAALSGMGLNTIYAMMHMRKHVNVRAARALCQAAAACGIELREEDLTVPQKSLNPLVGW